MKKLVEEAGTARATFVHEPSKWDLENAMKIVLLEGENVPPPEYRRPQHASRARAQREVKREVTHPSDQGRARGQGGLGGDNQIVRQTVRQTVRQSDRAGRAQKRETRTHEVKRARNDASTCANNPRAHP